MPGNRIRDAISSDLPKHNRPISDYKPDHSKGWSFSFKYFRQIDYFGLGNQGSNWFVSLIERLQDLSGKDYQAFSSSHKEKSDYRYHRINWDAKNIPIKRESLDWISSEILDNTEEFPFYQFQISKANGRVVGFWDANSTVFNIVLLDPMHNIQPAGKKFDYQVQKTTDLPCKYSALLVELDALKKKKCFCDKCTFKAELTEIEQRFNGGNLVYFQLDDDYYEVFKAKTCDLSVKELVELWLLSD